MNIWKINNHLVEKSPSVESHGRAFSLELCGYVDKFVDEYEFFK